MGHVVEVVGEESVEGEGWLVVVGLEQQQQQLFGWNDRVFDVLCNHYTSGTSGHSQ